MRAILAVVTALTLISADDAFAKAKDKKAEAAAAPVITEPLAAALPTYAQFQTDIALVNGGSIQEPKDIERAALTLVKGEWFARNRDPLIRSEDVHGVMSTTYWVGGLNAGASLPPDVEGLLAKHRQVLVG